MVVPVAGETQPLPPTADVVASGDGETVAAIGVNRPNVQVFKLLRVDELSHLEAL